LSQGYPVLYIEHLGLVGVAAPLIIPFGSEIEDTPDEISLGELGDAVHDGVDRRSEPLFVGMEMPRE
jgi:hypothetical protein